MTRAPRHFARDVGLYSGTNPVAPEASDEEGIILVKNRRTHGIILAAATIGTIGCRPERRTLNPEVTVSQPISVERPLDGRSRYEVTVSREGAKVRLRLTPSQCRTATRTKVETVELQEVRPSRLGQVGLIAGGLAVAGLGTYFVATASGRPAECPGMDDQCTTRSDAYTVGGVFGTGGLAMATVGGIRLAKRPVIERSRPTVREDVEVSDPHRCNVPLDDIGVRLHWPGGRVEGRTDSSGMADLEIPLGEYDTMSPTDHAVVEVDGGTVGSFALDRWLLAEWKNGRHVPEWMPLWMLEGMSSEQLQLDERLMFAILQCAGPTLLCDEMARAAEIDDSRLLALVGPICEAGVAPQVGARADVKDVFIPILVAPLKEDPFLNGLIGMFEMAQLQECILANASTGSMTVVPTR